MTQRVLVSNKIAGLRWCGLAVALAVMGVAPGAAYAQNAESPREVLIALNEKGKQAPPSESRTTTTIKSPVMQSNAQAVTLTARNAEGEALMHSQTVSHTTVMGQPPVESKTLIVVDGETMWTQVEVNGQSTISKAPMATKDTGELDGFIDLAQTAKASLLPDETLGGVPCRVVLIEQPGPTYTKLSIAKDTGVLQRLQTKAPNGFDTDTQVVSVKTDVTIDESFFIFTPPPGVAVVELPGPPQL